MVPAPAPPPVLVRVEGRLGQLILNRPSRINALDPEMVAEVRQALAGWATHPQVDFVLITGAGDRGLCAGGDLQAMYQAITDPSATGAPEQFWAAEYAMNAEIAQYPKPIVAVMDGITFGGGVGISAHAGVRIVTERSLIAMPETAIGLYPDVGALFLLARAPGEFGTHVALTGARLTATQAIWAGLADHFVRTEALAGIVAQLRTGELPDFPESAPTKHESWIDECYARPTVEQIRESLSQHRSPAARQAATDFDRMSPTSLKVTLAGIRRAASSTLGEVLEQDLRVCTRMLAHNDFREGIRAQIIDKDRRPRWRPAELASVTADTVAGFFAPLP